MKSENKVFTPLLQAAEDHLNKFINAVCFLVISHYRYWGRDKGVEEELKYASRIIA